MHYGWVSAVICLCLARMGSSYLGRVILCRTTRQEVTQNTTSKPEEGRGCQG